MNLDLSSFVAEGSLGRGWTDHNDDDSEQHSRAWLLGRRPLTEHERLGLCWKAGGRA